MSKLKVTHDTRELLREAGTNNWFPSRVVIGESLHDGVYCCLTNEQHWKLIIDFGITDSASHRLLLTMIVEIDEGYHINAEFDRMNGPIGEHRENLANIAKFAGKLCPLLAREPLLWHFEQEAAGLNVDAILKGLKHIHIIAGKLSKDAEYLRRVRVSEGPSHKSPERIYIWEPALRLWKELGHPLGYSENGPIMRILRVLHEGLRLAPPRPGAVRQAINDRKGRARAVKPATPG